MNAKDIVDAPITKEEVEKWLRSESERGVKRQRVMNWLSGVFGNFEVKSGTAKIIIMHAVDYSEVRKYLRDAMECETQATIMKTGQFAKIWGVRIFLDRKVTEPVVYGEVPDGCLGVMLEE